MDENNNQGSQDDLRDLTVREEHDGSAVVEFTDQGAVGGEQQTQTGNADDEDDSNLTDAEQEELVGKTEDEQEAIRARRRAERQHRKQVRKDRENLLQRQLEAERAARQQMEQRLAAIEQKNTGSELARIDVGIQEATNAAEYWKRQAAVFQSQNNGAAMMDATEKMFAAKQKAMELTNVKQAYSQRLSQPAPMDPRLLNNARAWLNDNKWYDPNARDEDSRIVRIIDDGVQADGFDPTTPEYWEELTSRVKRRLPHHFAAQTNTNGDSETTTRRNAPSHVTGSDRSSSGSAPGQRKGVGTFHLSAERVQAIKEAGKWDDPAERNKMIQRYRDYDRQHKA